MAKEKILVVGGGFGGVKAALELADDDRFDVTLLSDHSDLRYYPTLYHTATGGDRANSSVPFRTLFQDKSVKRVDGRAATIDRKAKTLTTENGEVFPYDTLVLGLGVVTNYFGIEGLKEYAYGIKTNQEAERLKRHLHEQMLQDHRPDPHYIIVGAGPTGIELAGSLTSYLKHIMKIHGLENRRVHVDLVEALPRLLPRLPKDASRMVRRRLSRLGIRLYLGQTVQGQTADELIINGKPLKSHTVIWTAGVTNNPFFSANQFVLTKRGKVATDIYLQAEDNIFVIGDNANTPYSGLAQTALIDGKFVADNLKRRKDNKSFKPYKPKMPVTVIPAGEHWAAVVYGGLRIYGWLGWMLREAADFNAFHNYENWPKAARQFWTEFDHEDSCTLCDSHDQR